MLTSQIVKEAAIAAGADICGIGSMDRFDGAPKDMDPRYLFPEAKKYYWIGLQNSSRSAARNRGGHSVLSISFYGVWWY